MRTLTAAVLGLSWASLTLAQTPPPAVPAVPTYKVGEWNELFNGRDFTGWACRNYKAHTWMPAEDFWKIEEGALLTIKGTDLWTVARFGDFELELEFRHDPERNQGNHGNSGVFLRRDNDDWLNTGFEIQVFKSYGRNPPGKQDCGALYDCVAPGTNALTEIGEWQKYHIMFKGNLLTVELNGVKIVDVNLDDWKEPHKNPDGSKNKFKFAYKDMARDGHIGLQFHGDPLMYRQLRIKPLTAPQPPVEK